MVNQQAWDNLAFLFVFGVVVVFFVAIIMVLVLLFFAVLRGIKGAPPKKEHNNG